MRKLWAAFAGAFPVMPYPSKLFPSSAAVPPSPVGVAFSPFQAAAAGRWVVCEPPFRLRWRLSASRPCSAAEVPGARWLLPAALARCFPGLVPGKGGRSASAGLNRPGRLSVRDRSRSPGRTRVHPVFRPDSDFGRGATGPRLIRRIARGSALPQRARRHAPKEPDGGVLRGGAASQHLARSSQAAETVCQEGAAQNRFLFSLELQVCVACRVTPAVPITK